MSKHKYFPNSTTSDVLLQYFHFYKACKHPTSQCLSSIVIQHNAAPSLSLLIPSVAEAPCYEFYLRSKVHEIVSCIWDQFCKGKLRLYGNTDHVLFVKCKSSMLALPTGSGTLQSLLHRRVTTYVAGRYPIFIAPYSIRQTTLPESPVPSIRPGSAPVHVRYP